MSDLISRSVWLLFRSSPCFNQTRFDDIFVLRQRIICIDIQIDLLIEKCVCKITAPNVRQRTCCYKEAEIIQRINNSHVVKLIAVSSNSITIMMEFCAFSFTPFNRDTTVNSLDEFLSHYNQEDLHCFSATILHKISSDTTKAVPNTFIPTI